MCHNVALPVKLPHSKWLNLVTIWFQFLFLFRQHQQIKLLLKKMQCIDWNILKSWNFRKNPAQCNMQYHSGLNDPRGFSIQRHRGDKSRSGFQGFEQKSGTSIRAKNWFCSSNARLHVVLCVLVYYRLEVVAKQTPSIQLIVSDPITVRLCLVCDNMFLVRTGLHPHLSKLCKIVLDSSDNCWLIVENIKH